MKRIISAASIVAALAVSLTVASSAMASHQPYYTKAWGPNYVCTASVTFPHMYYSDHWYISATGGQACDGSSPYMAADVPGHKHKVRAVGIMHGNRYHKFKHARMLSSSDISAQYVKTYIWQKIRLADGTGAWRVGADASKTWLGASYNDRATSASCLQNPADGSYNWASWWHSEVAPEFQTYSQAAAGNNDWYVMSPPLNSESDWTDCKVVLDQ